MGLLTRTRERAPCEVTISHRFEELSAHVKFLNGAVVNPGDSVLVHGAEIMAPYGECIVERREATITRASTIERLWTRATGDFEFMELCEFSFSEEVFPAAGPKEALS
ncbi:hypothetical protein KDD17_18560 [Sulfitobacter albidus]|uniref:Uncharacterized protein n=1 Tax=Sulfitobacter albidus TaxID=2829501 RepID=A0A975JH10_9RHOB|nr:hypothetical protein [Sulfitobacter albidus]QUJ78382.1 hypothetical protein KDD17_18560 [Sulfitobacter albidus]